MFLPCPRFNNKVLYYLIQNICLEIKYVNFHERWFLIKSKKKNIVKIIIIKFAIIFAKKSFNKMDARSYAYKQ